MYRPASPAAHLAALQETGAAASSGPVHGLQGCRLGGNNAVGST